MNTEGARIMGWIEERAKVRWEVRRGRVRERWRGRRTWCMKRVDSWGRAHGRDREAVMLGVDER